MRAQRLERVGIDLEALLGELRVSGGSEGPGKRAGTICFLEDENKGKVLLLQRNKEPFRGLWTALGGKVDPGEDPVQTIIREMREEAGLQIQDPWLRGITIEEGPPAYNWVLFVFRCSKYTGTPGQCDEGLLAWVEKASLPEIEMHEVDRRLLGAIFPEMAYHRPAAQGPPGHEMGMNREPVERRPFMAKVRYAGDRSLQSIEIIA
ncbi:MAG: NUDIX hydrolase [Syntrophothermus sp.]